MKRALVPIMAVPILLVLLSTSALGAAGNVPPELRWTFDTDPVGGLSRGAVVFSGTWAVRAETDAPSPPNVLCQTGVAQFPAIVLTDAVYANLVLSVRFKPIYGREDQAGGLIFRVQDKDNYYILRANALEDNVNIYKYVGGRRRFIRESATRVRPGQWQTLRVEATGNRIQGFLEERLVVEATDDTSKAGRIGLWTKADSVTCFDDAHVTAR